MLIAEANRGRLGNQLFTYAFARLLAEALEVRAFIPAVEGFPRTFEELAGPLTLAGPEELVTDANEPFDAVVARCRRQAVRVRVRGFFEQSRYYLPHRDKVRAWLTPSVRVPATEDTVVHVRGGDFIGHGKAVPASYFVRALWTVGVAAGGRVVVVTDEPGNDVVDYLLSCGAVLPEEDRTCPGTPRTALDDFGLLLSAQRLVISRSTFSWWAAFLGQAQAVAQPAPATGHRSKQDVLSNLTVPEWIQIPC